MEQCVAKVYPNTRWGAFHPHRCTQKVWKDGFCKTHHPDSEEERRSKSIDKYKEKCMKEKETKKMQVLRGLTNEELINECKKRGITYD